MGVDIRSPHGALKSGDCRYAKEGKPEKDSSGDRALGGGL
jgi:hypothetical protein